MFRGKGEAAEPVDLAEPVETPIREKRPAAEAECLKPSTFSSRAAKRVEHAAPRSDLVYMGTDSRTVTEYKRGGPDGVRLVDVALFYERHHPSRRWFRFLPHGVLEPMFDDSKREQDAVELPPMSSRTRLPGAFDPLPAEYRETVRSV